jgi:hypothetical protein
MQAEIGSSAENPERLCVIGKFWIIDHAARGRKPPHFQEFQYAAAYAGRETEIVGTENNAFGAHAPARRKTIE